MNRLSYLTTSKLEPSLKTVRSISAKREVNSCTYAASLVVLLSGALALSGCMQQNDANSSQEVGVEEQQTVQKNEVDQKQQTGSEATSKPLHLGHELSEVNENLLAPHEHDQLGQHNAEQIAQLRQNRATKTKLQVKSSAGMDVIQEHAYRDRASKVKPISMKMASGPLIDVTPRPIESRDKFALQKFDGIKLVSESPVSTFSVDVDTGGYSTMRRWLKQGKMPMQNTVRVEELINYFDYRYPVPESKTIPFTITTELASSPYNHGRQLFRVGVQGYEVDKASIGASNLVFLLDVSGSMSSPDKLPLLKQALMLLTQQLNEQDKVSIVVYAGASGVVLDGVSGDQTYEISTALGKLSSGGSTNGGAGIHLAYDLARKHFITGGNNRVILATDGDFNVGMTSQAALERLIVQQRQSGVQLTTLGFGQGNYNDTLTEQLADKGNGNYAYIDTLNEARKVLVDELSSQIFTIANDVKVQVEFNPAVVAEYRLIGYQNRRLKREDFNNDKVDAGDVGAGHNVTALYEISYVNSANPANDRLRYKSERRRIEEHQAKVSKAESNEQLVGTGYDELAYIKLRYKPSHNASSQLLTHVVKAGQNLPLNEPKSLSSASDDFRFAVAVAGFGQLLNGGQYLDDFDFAQVEAIAGSALGKDKFGYRHEFVQLVRTASSLQALSIRSEPKVKGKMVEPIIELPPKWKVGPVEPITRATPISKD